MALERLCPAFWLACAALGGRCLKPGATPGRVEDEGVAATAPLKPCPGPVRELLAAAAEAPPWELTGAATAPLRGAPEEGVLAAAAAELAAAAAL